MNEKTINKSNGPVRSTKYPWVKWLKGDKGHVPFEKPTVLTFGKDIPGDKKPAVLTAQIHQWAGILGVYAFTSVSADKKQISIYTVPVPKKIGKKEPMRPESLFPYPKQEKSAVAKKKAAAAQPESETKPAKKAAKKKPAKKSAKKTAKKTK